MNIGQYTAPKNSNNALFVLKYIRSLVPQASTQQQQPSLSTKILKLGSAAYILFHYFILSEVILFGNSLINMSFFTTINVRLFS